MKSCLVVDDSSVIRKVARRILEGMEFQITEAEDGLAVERMNGLHGIDFMTEPYPGFPTDMQAQLMALMCVADGASMITENIFEDRFGHADELRRRLVVDFARVVHAQHDLVAEPVAEEVHAQRDDQRQHHAGAPADPLADQHEQRGDGGHQDGRLHHVEHRGGFLVRGHIGPPR